MTPNFTSPRDRQPKTEGGEMSPSLADPGTQHLFHQIRQGPIFPLILLGIESSSHIWSGWARCCGFNLATQRLYGLPLHSRFSLHDTAMPAASLVMACPIVGQSFQMSGDIGPLRDPLLRNRFWQRHATTLHSLNLGPESLWEFRVETLEIDRFASDSLLHLCPESPSKPVPEALRG